MTLIASDAIADLGAWLEQLLAESTGKQGKGLIPVDAEPLGGRASTAKDRIFAYVRLHGVEDPAKDEAVRALEESRRAGAPGSCSPAPSACSRNSSAGRWPSPPPAR